MTKSTAKSEQIYRATFKSKDGKRFHEVVVHETQGPSLIAKSSEVFALYEGTHDGTGTDGLVAEFKIEKQTAFSQLRLAVFAVQKAVQKLRDAGHHELMIIGSMTAGRSAEALEQKRISEETAAGEAERVGQRREVFARASSALQQSLLD